MALGVDSSGNPVFDPSANVLSLVEAAVRRLDDVNQAEQKRNDQLREAESRRVDEQLSLRAEYESKLQIAEAKRIDAIRAVDVNAVAVASQRASDQATVLAAQVAQSAEALRGLVATTAANAAASQAQMVNTLSSRLTALEQAQYEGKGKSTIADPALIALVEQVKALAVSRDQTTGKDAGMSWVGALAVGAGTFLTAVVTIGSILYAMFK